MFRLPASVIFLISRAAYSLANAMMFTTYAVYYVNELGFNPLQLILVGTALELTIVLFEVPTGVVADAYSRRLSIVIGTAVLGVSYVMSAGVPFAGHLLPFFGAIVVAETVRGIGYTFLSGAFDAWLNDEVGTDKVSAVYFKAGKVGSAMSLLGIPVSVVLYNLQPSLPYFAGGMLMLLLALSMMLAMPETGFTPRPRENRSTWQMMSTTFMDGARSVRGRPVLMALLLISLIAGTASEGVARLWETHLLDTFRLPEISSLSPATWFGMLAAAGAVLSMITSHLGEKRLKLENSRAVTAVLLVAHSLRMATNFGFALAPTLGWAVAIHLSGSVLNAIYDPVYQTWMNQQIDSKVRATVLSFMGQMDAIGQTGGGPLVGWVGARVSVRAALVLSAALISPALAVYAWVCRRENPGSAQAQAQQM